VSVYTAHSVRNVLILVALFMELIWDLLCMRDCFVYLYALLNQLQQIIGTCIHEAKFTDMVCKESVAVCRGNRSKCHYVSNITVLLYCSGLTSVLRYVGVTIIIGICINT